MFFLALFHFLTRFLTSKHLKHFRGGAKWNDVKNVHFSSSNAKKKISWNIKTKCVTGFLLTSLRVWTIILVISRWGHKRQTFTLISIKIMRNWIFFFTCNRVYEHKEVLSYLHVCSNGLGKMWPSYTFQFSTRILTSTYTNEFNCFFSHNICHDVQQSVFNSRKCQNDMPNTYVLKIPSTLLLGIDMFT